MDSVNVGDDIEEMSVDVEEESENTYLTPEQSEGMDMKPNWWTTWSSLFLDNWFLWLIIGGSSLYVYHRYISPAIEKFMHTLADREMEAKLHKNPDLVRARQEAMLEARRKMQEKHDAEAARMAELRKLREEKKKEEMLSKNIGRYSNIGHTLNDAADSRRQNSPASPTNRTDYNPLMGSGSGGFRPQRRRPCSGGGCG